MLWENNAPHEIVKGCFEALETEGFEIELLETGLK